MDVGSTGRVRNEGWYSSDVTDYGHTRGQSEMGAQIFIYDIQGGWWIWSPIPSTIQRSTAQNTDLRIAENKLKKRNDKERERNSSCSHNCQRSGVGGRRVGYM